VRAKVTLRHAPGRRKRCAVSAPEELDQPSHVPTGEQPRLPTKGIDGPRLARRESRVRRRVCVHRSLKVRRTFNESV